MQLLNSLFEIVDSAEDAAGFSSIIRFFPDHDIFKGHFPGHPVTPGVVFLQMVHELLEHHLSKSIRLVELSTCKFLRVVNPEKDGTAQISITFTLKNEVLHVKALGKNDGGTIFKMDTDYCIVGS